LKEAKFKLEETGYEFREKASYPERLFFRIDYPYGKEKRRVHIHLVELGSQDWKEMIGFRDLLLKNPEIIDQYIAIKKESIKKAMGNGKKYREHKEKFIEEILRKAGIKF